MPTMQPRVQPVPVNRTQITTRLETRKPREARKQRAVDAVQLRGIGNEGGKDLLLSPLRWRLVPLTWKGRTAMKSVLKSTAARRLGGSLSLIWRLLPPQTSILNPFSSILTPFPFSLVPLQSDRVNSRQYSCNFSILTPFRWTRSRM